MSVNNPKYYVQLADCAIHYVALKRGSRKPGDFSCPYCKRDKMKRELTEQQPEEQSYETNDKETAQVC